MYYVDSNVFLFPVLYSMDSEAKAKIRLQIYSPALLHEVKDYIEEAAKNCSN